MTTATLSFDIEEFDFPIECGREISEADQFDISSEGLEFILQILKKKGITATFFVTANFAKHKPEHIKEIISNGFEVASHDYYHSANANSNIADSKKVLEEITGSEIIGYRAPRLGSESSLSLYNAGYRYNTSINPTWIPGRYNNLFSSRKASLEDKLVIYPVSVAYPIRFPLFWLALHLFPFKLYKVLANTALKHDHNINLYFHPWEFSERIKDKKYGIPVYISKTSGNTYRKKFEKFLDYLISQQVVFKTNKEYLGF